MIGPTIALTVVLKIVAVLIGGIGIFKLIDGLKDFFPAIFAKFPNLSRLINLISAALVGLLVCLGGEHPTEGVSLLGLIQCAIPIIATFFVANGAYAQSRASGDAVKPEKLEKKK